MLDDYDGRDRRGTGRLWTIADALGVPIATFFTGSPQDIREDRSVGPPVGEGEEMELVATFRAISDPATRAGILSVMKAAAAMECAHAATTRARRGRSDAG